MFTTRLITTSVLVGLLGTAAPTAAAPPVPFSTTSWGADTGFYLEDGSAWWPESMVTGDFNEDGRLDVVIANWGNFVTIAPRVSVLLATPSGMWGPPIHLTTPAATYAVAAADVDADNHLDLVVANAGFFWNEQTITVLRGVGDGTFLAGTDFNIGASGPTDVRLADVTGDGVLDAITANHGNGADSVSILTGDGHGGFGPAAVFPAIDTADRLALGDVDADGDLDIAVAGANSLVQQTDVALLRNAGDGTFGAPEAFASLVSSSVYKPDLVFADMDDDGDLDLVYSDNGVHTGGFQSSYAVAIYRNDGIGSFAAPEAYTIGIYTGGFTSLAVADLDGDGRLDVAGSHDANESWSILYGQPDGGLGDHTFLSAGEYPTDVIARDLDGDGAAELLVLSHFSQTIMVHYRAENGRFEQAPNANLVFGGHYHFDVGDIDNDGDLDVAASSGYADTGSISILRNDGAGGFGPFPIVYVAPTYAVAVKLRDLNGDNATDLLWADKYPPYSFRWRFNLGGGTFGTTQSSPDVFTCGVSIDDAINAWDLDLDGDLDVMLMENLGCAGEGTPKRLYISENDGTGSFQLRTIVETYLPAYEVMSADLNHDGLPDLVIAAHTIEVFLGTGNLTFGPGIVYGNVASRHATLADVDQDGHLDVLLTIPPQNDPRESMGVMRGTGTGAFGPLELYPATRSPNLAVQTSIVTGDVDGDGDADVLLGNYASNSTSLFLNRGDGTFDPQVHIGAMDNVRDVAFTDLTGDGVPDAVAMARFSNAGELGRDGLAILAGIDPAPMIPGDVNGDGVVGPADLAAVLDAWGPCPGCAADVDGNGVVGPADLALILQEWTG